MSVRVMSWVFERSRSKKNARLVLLAIADHAKDDGTGSYPSMPKLSHKTGLGERALTDLVALLEKLGELEVRRNAGPNGCNLYRVIMTPADSAGSPEDEMPESRDSDHVSAPAESAPRSSCTPQETTGTPAVPAPVTILEPSEISPTERSTRRRSKTTQPDRPDVQQVCEHLADRIVGNGCKRPTITKAWREEARLLLDKDGRTVEQVLRCIDWATSNNFWRKNILSMPTLREKYDRLRMDAEDERKAPNGRASPAQHNLVERNGMRLKPETAARLDDRRRFEAMDQAIANGAPLAIEGQR